MDTIHTVIEPNFISVNYDQQYKELIDSVLDAGESLRDIHRHYKQIFEGEVSESETMYKLKFRGSLKPDFVHISDTLLVDILSHSTCHGRAEVFRNDEVFYVEIELD